MSSRIHRPGHGVEPPPIVWRRAAGDAREATARDSEGAHGLPKPSEPGEEQNREWQARVEAARGKALAEGEAAGAQRAAATLEPAIAAFRSMTNQLSAQSRKRRAETEEDLVKLAIAIARRVLHRELATDPEAILGLVKAAAEKLNSRELHRLRLSPKYAGVVAAHRAALDLPPRVVIETDESLDAESVIFETVRGELDATVGTQLAEIERGLTDLVRRKADGGNRIDD